MVSAERPGVSRSVHVAVNGSLSEPSASTTAVDPRFPREDGVLDLGRGPSFGVERIGVNTIGDAVTVGVGGARCGLGIVFFHVGEPVGVRIAARIVDIGVEAVQALPPVGHAVAIRVDEERGPVAGGLEAPERAEVTDPAIGVQVIGSVDHRRPREEPEIIELGEERVPAANRGS